MTQTDDGRQPDVMNPSADGGRTSLRLKLYRGRKAVKRLQRNWRRLLNPRVAEDTAASVAAFHPLPGTAQPCPICGRDGLSHAAAYPSALMPFRNWVVYFCQKCGSGYVPEAAALLGDYYDHSYSQDYATDRLAPPNVYFDPSLTGVPKRQVARVASQIRSLKREGAKFGRCWIMAVGRGSFCTKPKPKHAFAIETDTAAHPHLDHIGATRLTEADLATQRFDLIVASHVVEHFDALERAPKLQAMLEALTPEGMLLIEVPQGGHSYLELSTRNDPHTILFTPDGLRRLVLRAGGTPLRCFARSKVKIALRDDPIYVPSKNSAFAREQHGGLTVIATRKAD